MRCRSCRWWMVMVRSACKRDSVGRCRSGGPVAIHLCGLPEGCPRPVGHGRTGRSFPLLGLAPDGVYRADAVTDIAGALLPHRFTLTCDRSPRGTRSIGGLSLLHVRQVAPTWLSPASCPVESRLSSTSQHATPRPPGHLTIAAEPTGAGERCRRTSRRPTGVLVIILRRYCARSSRDRRRRERRRTQQSGSSSL